MVQIMPPRTNLGAEIGQALKSGLSRGLEQGFDVSFQRGMLQKALEQAGNTAKQPGISPVDRTLGYLNAFAAIPGSEKYISTILPMLNQMAAFQEDQGQAPSTQFGKQFANQHQNETSRMPGKMIGGERVPEGTLSAFPEEEVDLYEPFLGPNVKKYNPLEISAREQHDLSRGLQSSPMADFMRKQNAEIENAVNTISSRQKDFANYYNAIHPNMNPDDQRIAQKFYRSKDALQAPTNEEKARVVDNFVDRYRALRTNIANQTPRSLVDKTRAEQKLELRNQIEWLLEEGQRDLAKEYLTKSLGFGDSESEGIIEPPTSQQEKLLTNFPKLPELDLKVPTFGKDSRLFQTYNQKRTEKLNDYEKRLEQAIKPGTAKKPGTSLLVLRDLSMETGMTWPEFNTMVNKLFKEKKITLDPYQLHELPKLTNPPYSGFMDMLIERK
jgi:hypothetical protein